MKTKLLIMVLAASTQIHVFAQNTQANSNSTETVLPAETETLASLNKKFIERAKMRIIDNEQSLTLLRSIKNINDKEEYTFYLEKVDLFEKRNLEMKNKINEFNITTGTKVEFMEFKKRWHWAMDELSVYEKNLMTENFLHK